MDSGQIYTHARVFSKVLYESLEEVKKFSQNEENWTDRLTGSRGGASLIERYSSRPGLRARR